jgi:hypothetical protein
MTHEMRYLLGFQVIFADKFQAKLKNQILIWCIQSDTMSTVTP